jgi:acetylornithine/N-succinyldiaminopimelate aminotransferase
MALEPGDHGSTFGGNALTTTAAYAGTKYLIGHDIPAHVKRMELYLLTHLQALREQFPCVAAVRGKGLLAAMEFDSDIASRVVTHANKAGVLLRGYPETLLSCLSDLKPHSCGNETQGAHQAQAA